MTNQNEADGEGLAAIGALSQSYRNVGAGANKHNHTMSNASNNQNTTSQYERVRNSYQSPTNKFSGNINSNMMNMQMGNF
jgi:hypothetical protein